MNIDINNISTVLPPTKETTVESPQSSQAKTDQVQNLNTLKGLQVPDKNKTVSDVAEAKEMAEALNEMMDDLQTSLGFYIREDLNHQVVMEIKDRNTNELIRQIPTEEMLAIKQKMEELTGLIFDQSV